MKVLRSLTPSKGRPEIKKRLLTTISTRQLRAALVIVLVFVGIKLIWIAQGQSSATNTFLTNPESASNRVRIVNGVKTVVRVHDTAERPQVALPQQNHKVINTRVPSGEICGVESRAAHGQVAPNTNGGTLDPVAFANPTTINASGRVAFNSQVDGSNRNQGVFVADSDGTIDR